MQESDLIFDWNTAFGSFDYSKVKGVELNDETLRDGLQSPSVTDPPIEEKIRLLRLMAELGIASLDIGLPGAGPRAVADVEALARVIAEEKLPIEANCAARTVLADVRPVVEVSQKVGIPIEAATFIGSSPIRQYAEDWTLERMPPVDLAALRIGTYELLWCDDVPDGVAVSEAVELVGSLSTDESAGFVNGLLGRLMSLKPSLAV